MKKFIWNAPMLYVSKEFYFILRFSSSWKTPILIRFSIWKLNFAYWVERVVPDGVPS